MFVFSLMSCNDDTPPDNGETDAENNGGVGNEGAENSTPSNVLDILALDFSIIYNEYEPSEKKLAEEIRDIIKEKTGVTLKVKSHTQKPSDYEIQFGTVNARDEVRAVLKLLDGCVRADSVAYSVAVKENKIVVTGTNYSAIKLAMAEFLKLIDGKKLEIAKDYEKSFVVFKDLGEEVFIPLSSFSSDINLTEIRISDYKLSDFSTNKKAYLATFPSTENYPIVSAQALNGGAKLTILQAENNEGVAKITVKSEDGTKECIYTVKFTHAENANISSKIVNKNGASGVVSFVFDDGAEKTADILMSNLLPKYNDVNVSFGIITNQLAAVFGTKDEYAFTPVENDYNTYISGSVFTGKRYKYNYEFWKDVIKGGRAELISHSHTHDGPTMVLDPYKELKASQLILKELCGEDALTYVNPGVGDYGKDENYNNLRVNSGIYLGARAGGGAFATAEWLKSDFKNRFSIPALAVNYYGTAKDENGEVTTDVNASYEDCIAQGIPVWKDHIALAVEGGGWTSFCFHNIILDSERSGAKWYVYESQVDKLFAYAQELSDDGKLWIASFTDAQIYYNQWSSSVVNTTVVGDDSVTVSITDSEDNSVCHMEMTVKVPVPKSWIEAKFDYNGNSGNLTVHENDDGTKYVYVNIIPDVSSLTLTEKQ